MYVPFPRFNKDIADDSKDTYYMTFPRDSRVIVVLVYTTLVIGTVHAIISTSTAWHVFAIGFGDVFPLFSIQTRWFNMPLVGGAGE